MEDTNAINAIIPKNFTCSSCKTITEAPSHCGKPMKLMKNTETGICEWVCWKGEHEPCCGKESMIKQDPCCELSNLNPNGGINPENVLM